MRGAGWALARLPQELDVEQERLLDAPPPPCDGDPKGRDLPTALEICFQALLLLRKRAQWSWQGKKSLQKTTSSCGWRRTFYKEM